MVIAFSKPATTSFELRWTLTGTGNTTDFPLITKTVTVPVGATSVVDTIATIENLTYEGNRTYTLTFEALDGQSLATKVVDFTIVDDEAPVSVHVAIDNVTLAEGNGGGNSTQTFNITLSGISTQDVVLNYATADGTATTADSDYTSTSGTLTILAGATTASINVNVARDAKNEGNETFTLGISGTGYVTTGSTLNATGTITNDDTAPTVQWSVASNSAAESAGTVTITAELSAVNGIATSVPYTLTGTATATTDYTITASPLSIPAGSLSANVTVTLVADTAVETNETIIATIGSPTGATAAGNTVHTLTVLDDDLTAFAISGVRSAGGLDVTTDAYLNFEAAPRFLWATSTGATSYDVTVYENDGTTVKCALQNTAATTYDPTACSLTAGDSYKLKVTAKNVNNNTLDASNSLYTFVYNRSPVISATRGTWKFNPGTGRTFNVISDDTATVAVDPATDADTDVIDILSVGTPTHGTVTFLSQSITYTPTAGYDGSDSFTVTIKDTRGGSATTTVSVTSISQFHWTGFVGAGASTNVSDTKNWCGTITGSPGDCNNAGAVPGSGDVAVFDANCVQCDVTVNIGVSVAGIDIKSGYTGTITQSSGQNIVVGSSGFSMAGGTFLGSTDPATAITVNLANFRILSGASFTSTSGTLTLHSNTATTVSRAYDFLGTFIHNSGTVSFTGYNTSGSASTTTMGLIDAATTVDFYNLAVNYYNSTVNTVPTAHHLKITNGDTIRIANNLTMTSGGITDGNIELSGNLIANCSAVTSCASQPTNTLPATLNWVGNTNTTYTTTGAYSTPFVPIFIINKTASNRTVSSANNSTIRISGLDIQSGEFIAPTAELLIGYDMNSTTGNSSTMLHLGALGAFTHNSGTVTLRTDKSTGSSSSGTSVSSTFTNPITFNHLKMNFTASSGYRIFRWSISAGSVANILGNFTLEGGYIVNGTINLFGNFSATCTSVDKCALKPYTSSTAPSGTLNFVGSAAQTYTFATGATGPGFIINKTSLTDTVSPTAGSDLNVAFIDVRQGTLNLPTTITRIGQRMIQNEEDPRSTGVSLAAGAGNGAINHNNGTVIFVGEAATFHTVQRRSMGNITLNGRSLSLNHVILALIYGPTNTAYPTLFMEETDSLTILGDYTVDSGIIITSTSSTNPTTDNLIIQGNVAFNCSDAANNVCAWYASNSSNTNYGVRAKLIGTSKTITQQTGARFGFRKMQVDLSDNTQQLIMNSNLDGNNQYSARWVDIFLTTGIVNTGIFSFNNILNLDITAGATCTAPLIYSTSSGATGSGCGP